MGGRCAVSCTCYFSPLTTGYVQLLPSCQNSISSLCSFYSRQLQLTAHLPAILLFPVRSTPLSAGGPRWGSSRPSRRPCTPLRSRVSSRRRPCWRSPAGGSRAGTRRCTSERSRTWTGEVSWGYTQWVEKGKRTHQAQFAAWTLASADTPSLQQ